MEKLIVAVVVVVVVVVVVAVVVVAVQNGNCSHIFYSPARP